MSELRTERLILRPPQESDFADLAALWRDAEAIRHIGPPASRAEAWARLLKYAGHWAIFGFGYRVIRDAATGRFVGEAGIAYQRRDTLPELGGDPEAGWALMPEAQGQGLASEALGAVLDDAARTLAPPRITCLITPANTASIRLAERQHFVAFGTGALGETPVTLFERRLA